MGLKQNALFQSVSQLRCAGDRYVEKCVGDEKLILEEMASSY